MRRQAPISRQEFDFTSGEAVVVPAPEGTWAALTVDTGQVYRGIMLSDGTVRAIPFDALPPETPLGVSGVVRLTSVSLTWTAAAGAVSYQIKRDGANYATSASNSYRDASVTVGQTYEYKISSMDQYQQRSPDSEPVSAFIDIELNQAPSSVVITCWPTPIPTDGPAYVRVNAHEIDVHDIAYALNVDAGTLQDTNDPSLWIITI